MVDYDSLNELHQKYNNDEKYITRYKKTIKKKGVKYEKEVVLKDYIQMYKDFVNENSIPLSKKMRLQMERVDKILENPKYDYDLKLANKPIIFIEKYCKFTENPMTGKPIRLSEWEKYYIAVSHGIVYKDTRQRLTKELAVIIARKNNKTTGLAGLSLYHLLADGESGAQVYSVATKKDQAKLLFTAATNMVKQSKFLTKKVFLRKVSIDYEKNFSTMKALASDSNSLDGLNVSVGVFDELHAFTDMNLIDVIKSSQGARLQPLLIFITTNGKTRGKVFDSRYDYYDNILNGLIEDDTVMPFIYEMDDIKEINNMDLWIKANPNLGRSVRLDTLKGYVKTAFDDPVQRIGVFMKHFNIPQNPQTAFFEREYCVLENYDPEQLKNSYGFGGLDMTYTTDLACFTYLTKEISSLQKDYNEYLSKWDGEGDYYDYMLKYDKADELIQMEESDNYLVKQIYFKPADLIEEHSKKDKIDYQMFVDRGDIILCPGDTVKQEFVLSKILEFAEENNITYRKFAVDNYRAEIIINRLNLMYDSDFAMHTDIKLKKAITRIAYKLQTLLKGKKIKSNEKLLPIHLGGVEAKVDNAELLTIQKLTSTSRIDGSVSLMYALKAEELYNVTK